MKRVVAQARATADAVVIVLGEYNVRPSSSIRSALKEAKSFFKQSRLPENRYIVRIKPSAYYDPEYSAARKPKYPSAVVVAAQVLREPQHSGTIDFVRPTNQGELVSKKRMIPITLSPHQRRPISMNKNFRKIAVKLL